MLSFAMVLAIGFLLLVSLVASAVLSAIGTYFSTRVSFSPELFQGVNLILSFAPITLLFALIFKVLPETEVAWKDVWLGAALTAFLFSIGKFLIGLYLGKSSITSAFGASGSIVIILVWTYYSSLILFLGAEFTYIYSHPNAPRGPRPIAA